MISLLTVLVDSFSYSTPSYLDLLQFGHVLDYHLPNVETYH